MEYRFVESPFEESVDGRISLFTNMEFIGQIKAEAVRRGLKLSDVEKFVLKCDGWWGVYGTFAGAEDFLDDFEKFTGISKEELR